MKEELAIREYRPEDQTQVIEIVRDIQRHEGSFFDRMLPPEAIGEWYVEKQLQDCARTGGAIMGRGNRRQGGRLRIVAD